MQPKPTVPDLYASSIVTQRKRTTCSEEDEALRMHWGQLPGATALARNGLRDVSGRPSNAAPTICAEQQTVSPFNSDRETTRVVQCAWQ